MNLIFVLIGLNVPIIFMFKINWLYSKKSMTVILLLNMCLFIVAVVLQNSETDYPKTLTALKMPSLSVIIFYILHQSFKILYKRNPENTFWVFNKKPTEDILFSALFWIIGIGLPLYFLLTDVTKRVNTKLLIAWRKF